MSDERCTGSTVWRIVPPEPPRHGYFWWLWPAVVVGLAVLMIAGAVT